LIGQSVKISDRRQEKRHFALNIFIYPKKI